MAAAQSHKSLFTASSCGASSSGASSSGASTSGASTSGASVGAAVPSAVGASSLQEFSPLTISRRSSTRTQCCSSSPGAAPESAASCARACVSSTSCSVPAARIAFGRPAAWALLAASSISRASSRTSPCGARAATARSAAAPPAETSCNAAPRRATQPRFESWTSNKKRSATRVGRRTRSWSIAAARAAASSSSSADGAAPFAAPFAVAFSGAPLASGSAAVASASASAAARRLASVARSDTQASIAPGSRSLSPTFFASVSSTAAAARTSASKQATAGTTTLREAWRNKSVKSFPPWSLCFFLSHFSKKSKQCGNAPPSPWNPR
mmetsp:Transcript_28963/g.97687  ORF Transcript_28963/g.97687 Transcript_28963/m.97687 type:complete len:326 (-) Transcript_28963:267-1244(-)